MTCAAILLFAGLHNGGLIGAHLAEIRAADAAGADDFFAWKEAS